MKNRKIKIVKTGLVAKDVEIAEIMTEGFNGIFSHWDLDLVYPFKGTKDDWDEETSWPPRKVRITIEEIKA